jgi:hypothetical protein
MSRVSPAIAGLGILLSVSAAQAQLFGPRPDPRPAAGANAIPENFDPAMCDELASIPNAPMTAEACRSMMGMAKSMQSASSDPNAMRPGDETMSCDQLLAEMRATGRPMVSAETAAQSTVASDATLSLMQKQNAETKAFMAGQIAVGIGASALGMVPGGNIAASAIAAAQQAQAQNFAAKQAQEAAPVRAQMNQAITATGNDVGQSIQENPRFARLAQLVTDKQCPIPQDAGPPTP